MDSSLNFQKIEMIHVFITVYLQIKSMVEILTK